MDHNFDLQLSCSPATVNAQVLDSPAGQTPAPIPLPCIAGLADLDDLASGPALQGIGRALWRCAFGAPAVAELWRASVALSDTLRLRLVIDSPELAGLPWELLYDETLGRFLALDGRTPVTRFTRLPIPAIPWPQDRPLRLLFTGASPATMPRLDTATEWAGVERALAPLVEAGRIEAKAIPQGATLADLLAALRRGVDLWHFAGHGTDEGIVFVGAGGREMLVEAETLGQLLAGEGVRLAVLNACRAGAGGGQAASVAGALLRADVPAVVAMQADVSDAAADAFAAAFYDAIAVGQGVDRALTAARKAILATKSSTEWWIPALFMRTPEGRIWQEPEQSAATEQTIVRFTGDRNSVITGRVGGNVTVTIGGYDVRGEELAYLDGLIEKYRYWAEKYTPLAGIAEVRAAVAEGPRLDLPMLFMPTGFEKLEEHGFGEQRQTERVSVDDLREAVKRYKRLVLLGEPGSGKTTTLWRLAYDFAVAAREDPHAPLPVFVPLGGYTGPENAQAYVQGFFEEHGPYLSAYLRSKRVILLLDALNEMPQTGYEERVGRIQALLDQHSDLSVVVTCRALDYVGTLRLGKLEINLLDPDRQRAYLHRYLGEDEGEKLFWQMAGKELEAIWNRTRPFGMTNSIFWDKGFAPSIDVTVAVDSSGAQHVFDFLNETGPKGVIGYLFDISRQDLPPLLALSRNPYMLVMLAQVYAAQGGVLPQNRGLLFAAFVGTLLDREEKRCNPTLWPGADVLRRSMIQLAYAMQEAGERGTAVDAQWAAKQMAQRGVDVSRIAYLCASATLLDTSNSQIRFVHQLVQEYFTALALAGRLHKGDNLQRYCSKDWTQSNGWEETLILLAGMLPDMTILIERLLPVHPALAARCIAESGGERPAEATVRTVQQRLADLMTDPQVPIPQRNAAGVAINYVGDPRRGVGLRLDGLPDLEWVLVQDAHPTGRREFIYGDNKRLTERDFWIARYPTTYAQFQAFLDAKDDGFRHDHWWDGLAAPQEHRSRPGEQRFKHWNHPRERVSWYDAIAFCRWMTEKAKGHLDLLPAELDLNRDWKITLPTEWQWENAAVGHDGRQYPWGEKYEKGWAIVHETDWCGEPEDRPYFLAEASAVGIYLRCVSPYGVADLGGKGWEWCLNEYSSNKTDLGGNASRVLRCGSLLDLNYDRTVRIYDRPDSRDFYYGFRVVVVGWRPNA